MGAVKINLLRAHGTQPRYAKGCRCQLCKTAHSQCNLAYDRAHPEKKLARSRRYDAMHRDEHRAYSLAHYAENRDRHLLWARVHRDPESQEYKAHMQFSYRRRVGLLVPQPCEVCGETVVDGHHDDYEKPLEVRWLCRSHHKLHHAQQERSNEH